MIKLEGGFVQNLRPMTRLLSGDGFFHDPCHRLMHVEMEAVDVRL